jgi:DNA invertase Pin-like site-specific DNA recombinase
MATTLSLPAPIRAAIYCRISKDDGHDELGVRRQERDCRALAERKGWSVTEVFVDDDVSAYVPGKRPAYAQLLEAIRAGEVDAVAVYDLDRLHRHPRELEAFFEACDAARLTRLASVSGDVDLAGNDGRLVARIMGAVAKKASDDSSRRIKRKNDERAERGLPHGTAAFGYGPPDAEGKRGDPTVIVKSEAVLLRRAAADVLAGESLAAIARRWNGLGVATAQGAPGWNSTTVKAVLTNPRQAGLRTHRGEVVGPGAWPAILDRATHERLVALLTDPARRAANPPRRTPFTGLVHCDRCGEVMTRDPRGGYRCKADAGRPACGRVSIAARASEELIVEAVMLRLDTPELARAIPGARDTGADDTAAAELADVEQRLADLAEMFAGGEIGRGEWLRARKSLETRQTAARATLARYRRTTALDPYEGRAGALRAAWPNLSPDQQRGVLAAVVDRVSIKPATARRGPKFDAERVDIIWRA